MKTALFAFNGEAGCFVHVLLNGLDLHQRGYEVKIVIEGAAVKLLPELDKEDAPLSKLFRKARESGIVEGFCKACANKMGTLEAGQALDLPELSEMSGHPAVGSYLEAGWQVITF